ncbi:MAG: TetR/AcrR family transcriptional regulator [Clostridia bacterium]|nr:TetR/AcrR family transcriptional regulator [Clostridia bacterium]
MPPKFKFTREEIVQSALDLTREKGIAAVTARGLAEKLGCSVKPIFGLFQNMEEVHREIIASANRLFLCRMEETMASGAYPPYKASGMAYILFAIEERELFRLLFMRDRSHERIPEGFDEIKPVIELVQANTGLSEEEANLFHLEMWVYVHGIATMLATSYLNWDKKLIEKTLTDAYEGLKFRFTGGKQ